MPAIKYRVTLTDDEVEMLEALLRKRQMEIHCSGSTPKTRSPLSLRFIVTDY